MWNAIRNKSLLTTECDLVRNMHIDKSPRNVLLLLVIACGFWGIPGLLHLCVLLVLRELERGMCLCVQ